MTPTQRKLIVRHAKLVNTSFKKALVLHTDLILSHPEAAGLNEDEVIDLVLEVFFRKVT